VGGGGQACGRGEEKNRAGTYQWPDQTAKIAKTKKRRDGGCRLKGEVPKRREECKEVKRKKASVKLRFGEKGGRGKKDPKEKVKLNERGSQREKTKLNAAHIEHGSNLIPRKCWKRLKESPSRRKRHSPYNGHENPQKEKEKKTKRVENETILLQEEAP